MKKFLSLVFRALMLASLVACSSTSTADNNSDNQNDTKHGGWEEISVYQIIPEPKSKNWKMFSNENDYLDINVFDTSLDDYNTYISSCEDYGFEMYIYDDTDENEYECEGYNKYHSELYINYDDERKTMHIQLDASIEKNPLEWSTSKLAQMLPIPENAKGYIDADREEKYQVILMDVSLSDFNAYVDGCIEKGFTLDSENYSTYYRAKNENGYVVTVEFGEMDREMGITLKVADTE